jgi:hypothetical protein
MRRALDIFVASLGVDHPNLQLWVRNYRSLLTEMQN